MLSLEELIILTNLIIFCTVLPFNASKMMLIFEAFSLKSAYFSDYQGKLIFKEASVIGDGVENLFDIFWK